MKQGQEKRTEQELHDDHAAQSADATVSEPEPTSGNSGMEEKLAVAEAKLTEMQDAFLRAKAESENMRRRAQEDIARAHKFAIESFAEALVPVKDSLEMALKVETPSVESLKEGVEMTLKQLSSAFEKNRLIEIHPKAGEKLDPMKHQAISMVPAEQEANTIVTVLQKGYMIADRLLRPALVTVSQEKTS
ncbi:MAG: nucleotide exchange factor GrpE [Herminiimonas sp.]|nr:nucleotide exchange factor GrpE [Herminiimonas sp.]